MNSELYRSLKNELDRGKRAVMVTLLKDGKSGGNYSHNGFVLTEEQLSTADSPPQIDEGIFKSAQLALRTGNLQYDRDSKAQGKGTEALIEPYFPKPRLIILGGGHIAKPLAEFGARVGFLITIVDDRPKFANRDRFPDAEKVICESFLNCFSELDLNDSASVVIVTRGHRNDMDCLRQVLNYKTAYTGMIGSKRRVKIVREQLLEEGFSKEAINWVNAPIGLDIGAVTPEEIAIAIIAQIISYRRLTSISAPTGDKTTVKVNWPELDMTVLDEMCMDADDPKALITIIETKGSVPRKAGAKMLVWPYGKTMGSIGGGCAEGEVINIAWDVIGSGGYKIHEIDMTGQIAEEEGMVCGGVMRVLIEDYNG